MNVERDDQRNSTVRLRLTWLGAATLSVLLLSLLAGMAPVGLRKLVLFHAVFGILCGLLLQRLTAAIRPDWGRWLLPLTGVVVLLGGLNLAWVSYRPFVKERDAFRQKRSRDLATMNMMLEIAADDAEVQQQYAEERRDYESGFSDYLANRVALLGRWRSPWPLVFWFCELGLAAGLAIETVRRGQAPGQSGNLSAGDQNTAPSPEQRA